MGSTGAYLIGKTIYNHTKNTEFDAIGGHAMGAIPLVTATVLRYWRRERRIKEGFFVCSGQVVEGLITDLHKAIVIEDVCTTGASAAIVVKALQDLIGCKVVGVLALIDREEGARERFQKMNIPFDSIFKAKNLLDRSLNVG
jgi:orotate phosphoribosyltransferase